MKKWTILTFAALMILSSCNTNNTEMENRDFMQLAADRYSVRSFESTPVDQKTIDQIIRAGQIAPTAVNAQPQKIYVAKSESAMAKLNEISPCIYGAPHCFIFCYDDTIAAKRGEGDYGTIDATIILTHMMFEAENLGVGTCIVGYFDPAKLSEAFELPANIHPVLLMPFGYPSENSVPSENHTSYRPLEETVEEI